MIININTIPTLSNFGCLRMFFSALLISLNYIFNN